jgi:alkanesulfonate monooxygenase SsuD/methylene tetrahydromethanopterin reductase-like flavin-dependent oxidoreductase (luciferase family)
MLWLSGPKTIEQHIGPAMHEAASAAGRPPPRIIGSVPVCVTEQPVHVRGTIAAVLAGYNDLPSYRGMMDIEGVDGPEGVSIVGDEDEVRAGLARFADAGATDFAALEFFTSDEEAAATRHVLRQVQAST